MDSPTVTLQPVSRMELTTSPQMEREEEKRMLPCRFFVNGYCHKGNRCRFYHPSPSNMQHVIRVPPLPAGFGGLQTIMDRSPPSNTGGRGSGYQIQVQSEDRGRNYNTSPPQHGRGQPSSYIMPMGQNGMGMGAGTMSTNNPNPIGTGRRSRSYELPGLGTYSTTNVNGLQTYDYDNNGEESALIHQQLMETASQSTLFTHIDWADFLAPGKLPPPITSVPEQECQSPPYMRKLRQQLLAPQSFGDQCEVGDSSGDEKVQASLSNEDMPPEGSSVRRISESGISEESDMTEDDSRKLSAKEELQMKVKKIAMELADEPPAPVRSLDSFFHDYPNIDFLPAPMLTGTAVCRPRKKLELREDPATSTSASSGDEGSVMSDSSRNDDVAEAVKVIESCFKIMTIEEKSEETSGEDGGVPGEIEVGVEVGEETQV